MKSIKKIIQYFTALFLVLSNNSLYYISNNQNSYMREILIVLFSIILMFHITSKDFDKKKLSKSVVFLFFYYIYMIIFIILNNMDKKINFIFIFILFFSVVFLVYSTSKENIMCMQILEKIPKIMVVLSIISLFFYFLGSLTNIIHSTKMIKISWGRERYIPSYYGLHFDTQTIGIFSTRIPRNTGLFPEAPMFGMNLTIALAIEKFLIKRKNKTLKNILLFTTFTTTSATAIVLVSIIELVSFYFERGATVLKRNLKVIGLPLMIVIFGTASWYIISQRQQTDTVSTRFDDYKACYMAWKEKKIVGNGYNNTSIIKKYMSSFRRYNQGMSSGIMIILVQGGIYLFIFHVISMYRGIKYGIVNKKIEISFFTIIMIILLSTTAIHYRLMVMNFLIIGVALPLNNKDGGKKNEI